LVPVQVQTQVNDEITSPSDKHDTVDDLDDEETRSTLSALPIETLVEDPTVGDEQLSGITEEGPVQLLAQVNFTSTDTLKKSNEVESSSVNHEENYWDAHHEEDHFEASEFSGGGSSQETEAPVADSQNISNSVSVNEDEVKISTPDLDLSSSILPIPCPTDIVGGAEAETAHTFPPTLKHNLQSMLSRQVSDVHDVASVDDETSSSASSSHSESDFRPNVDGSPIEASPLQAITDIGSDVVVITDDEDEDQHSNASESNEGKFELV
jgi:hypothetical protein